MKPHPYHPEPNTLTALALLSLHAAGDAGLSSSELARAINRTSNEINGLLRKQIQAGIITVRHVDGTNAVGDHRRVRVYVGTPNLQPCIDHLASLGADTVPAPAGSGHPALDRWLRNAAATIPRLPLPGFRVVSDFPNLGRASA